MIAAGADYFSVVPFVKSYAEAAATYGEPFTNAFNEFIENGIPLKEAIEAAKGAAIYGESFTNAFNELIKNGMPPKEASYVASFGIIGGEPFTNAFNEFIKNGMPLNEAIWAAWRVANDAASAVLDEDAEYWYNNDATDEEKAIYDAKRAAGRSPREAREQAEREIAWNKDAEYWYNNDATDEEKQLFDEMKEAGLRSGEARTYVDLANRYGDVFVNEFNAGIAKGWTIQYALESAKALAI